VPAIDWHSMFHPEVSLLELIIRGTIIYLFLFTALRLLRRQAGALGVSDLLVLVLIADAAQNAMASEYKSVPEGLVLISTILFWDWALDWLAYRFPPLARVLHAPPVPLVVAGQLQQRNMHRQMLCVEELLAQLRQHGIDDLTAVRLCNLEGDGHISVLKFDPGDDDASSQGQARGVGS